MWMSGGGWTDGRRRVRESMREMTLEDLSLSFSLSLSSLSVLSVLSSFLWHRQLECRTPPSYGCDRVVYRQGPSRFKPVGRTLIGLRLPSVSNNSSSPPAHPLSLSLSLLLLSVVPAVPAIPYVVYSSPTSSLTCST
jgi:hypothetical protein